MNALAFLFAVLMASVVAAQTPHPNAHSHNDYFRAHPVFDALDNGFGSIEADIHLVDGRLLVAHDRAHVSPGRELESMYLAPLRERCRTNAGQVYRGGKNDFHLLVDIKSDADAVYTVLGPMLARYRDILTRFTDDSTTPGAVTVILSGDRPTSRVAADKERWCGIDGRLPDLERNPSPHLVPWMSDSWRPTFGALRGGRLSDRDRARLREVCATAHAQGRKVRFWDTPDRPDMWRELRDGGVDILNADDLPVLGAFLAGKPAPKKRPLAEE
jgi:hypothetical protein